MWDEALLIAGVVLFPLPALVLGARGLFRHRGYVTGDPNDRASVVVLVTLRMLVLLLLLALSGITLVSCIGDKVISNGFVTKTHRLVTIADLAQ